MTTKFKLAIADLVGVKVKGFTQEADGSERPFEFVLVCDRKSQSELRTLTSDREATANEFFEQHAKGWRDQTLVLGEDGMPAAFSVDALRVMFSIAGMSAACWDAYLRQVMVTAKN